MATFEALTHPLAFAHMESGQKTVFVLPWSLERSVISSGDRVEFDGLGSISIGMVRRYDTLEELLEAEGFANVVPEVDDASQAAVAVRGDVSFQGASEGEGVLALRVRWAKRAS
jgi:ASC-1-like (ASCH) protein